MNDELLDKIANVTVMSMFGSTVYHVTLKDGTIMDVPNDPMNRWYPAVQEWLAEHPSA